MRIADVIGTVTLNRAHPSVAGATWKLVVPLSWDNLLGKSDQPAEEVVVLDELGAGLGSRIALSEGREAAMPFFPAVKPIDAYNAAILDTFQVEIPGDLKPYGGTSERSECRPTMIDNDTSDGGPALAALACPTLRLSPKH